LEKNYYSNLLSIVLVWHGTDVIQLRSKPHINGNAPFFFSQIISICLHECGPVYSVNIAKTTFQTTQKENYTPNK
jgi:hypothetical protein